ncbi:hypothetical protein [Streptomyces sp. Isolate_45]|uniref:hypothetical protein n=1 Tax=Streptomyces sp. Isolate_45 TaxID=2950111 RepID=UPI002481BB0D|nr:hypothetical protein [Streptomyces sp. Isolate_45]MDA5279861.1 hypothetical protein [Streptomyces sp. Isolate_45]
MKFWPYKMLRAGRFAELLDAEGAVTVALSESVDMEESRDEARKQRDAALADAHELRQILAKQAVEMRELRSRLDLADHGAGHVCVLLNHGEAISAHRSVDDAKGAARLHFGIATGGWGRDASRPLTTGVVISTIPLVADTTAAPNAQKEVTA